MCAVVWDYLCKKDIKLVEMNAEKVEAHRKYLQELGRKGSVAWKNFYGDRPQWERARYWVEGELKREGSKYSLELVLRDSRTNRTVHSSVVFLYPPSYIENIRNEYKMLLERKRKERMVLVVVGAVAGLILLGWFFSLVIASAKKRAMLRDVDEVVVMVEDLMKEGKYVSAVCRLEQALQYAPNHPELQELQARMEIVFGGEFSKESAKMAEAGRALSLKAEEYLSQNNYAGLEGILQQMERMKLSTPEVVTVKKKIETARKELEYKRQEEQKKAYQKKIEQAKKKVAQGILPSVEGVEFPPPLTPVDIVAQDGTVLRVIAGSKVVMGRFSQKQENRPDLPLPADYRKISRRHLVVTLKDRDVIVEDISKKGTYIGGEQIKRIALEGGEVLSLGKQLNLTVEIMKGEGMEDWGGETMTSSMVSSPKEICGVLFSGEGLHLLIVKSVAQLPKVVEKEMKLGDVVFVNVEGRVGVVNMGGGLVEIGDVSLGLGEGWILSEGVKLKVGKGGFSVSTLKHASQLDTDSATLE
ncbi:MAG: hypothetical protein DRP11_04470 [Candidatus Aenigmatarchaeota archaeon]|nr:MAG: hypothetical protein DRP11_04470 [Candidatus Aenigmarchaeota archaeon]